jgi:hypothetical protein
MHALDVPTAPFKVQAVALERLPQQLAHGLHLRLELIELEQLGARERHPARAGTAGLFRRQQDADLRDAEAAFAREGDQGEPGKLAAVVDPPARRPTRPSQQAHPFVVPHGGGRHACSLRQLADEHVAPRA